MWRRFVVNLLCIIFTATGAFAAGYDDFANGLSANNRQENDLAISSFTTALKAGDLNASLVPLAYQGRAVAYLREREYALAITDLAAAIKLKPDYLDAYQARAFANMCLGDTAAAIADYTKIVALRPTVEAFRGRGYAYWSTGDFSDAAADFAEREKLAPKPAYALIWLALSQMRLGTFHAGDVTDEISKRDLEGWPRPILDLYVSQLKPDDVARLAAIGDAAVVLKQRCEADFYVGEWWLVQPNVDSAKPLLEDARHDCLHNMWEYSAAQIELKRLK